MPHLLSLEVRHICHRSARINMFQNRASAEMNLSEIELRSLKICVKKIAAILPVMLAIIIAVETQDQRALLNFKVRNQIHRFDLFSKLGSSTKILIEQNFHYRYSTSFTYERYKCCYCKLASRSS